MYNHVNYYKACILFAIILLQIVITSCTYSKATETENNYSRYTADGAYIIQNDNYLYYYKFDYGVFDLCRYNLNTSEDEYIDNAYNAKEGGHVGLSMMFCLNGTVYYAKSDAEDRTKTLIYSINNDNIIPEFKGIINDELYNDEPEMAFDEYRMFQTDDNLYVLMRNKLYELNGEESELIIDGINSIYYDGESAYYSLVDKDNDYPFYTDGIFCYSLKSKSNREVVTRTEIEQYNMYSTVMGPQAAVRNILKDNEDLYFLGADYKSAVLKCSANGYSNIDGVTNKLEDHRYTYAFRINNHKMYYKGFRQTLCSVDLDGSNAKEIIPNVYTYNVQGNYIYYYKIVDSSVAELRRYNIIDSSDELLVSM